MLAKTRNLGVFCLLSALAAGSVTFAEDVAGRWRLSGAVGGYNADDAVESSAANRLDVLNTCIRTLSCAPGEDIVLQRFRDPRNDSDVFGSLDVNPAFIGTLAVQFGLNKIMVLEGSVGYQKGDVGDVTVSADIPGNDSVDPELIPFNYVSQRITVGELERVPIQLSALARFRPRATFNPYIGAGIGYSIIGFESDPELDTLSQRIDASLGVQTRLLPIFSNGVGSIGGATTDGIAQTDLDGAYVDFRDTFEYHIAGGAEITIKKNWSAFVDVRWVDASKSFAVGFNNSDELGNSLPQFQAYSDNPIASARYGPNRIGNCAIDTTLDPADGPLVSCDGGIADFGFATLAPTETNPDSDCTDPIQAGNNALCELSFVNEPDGIPDAGDYYVQGGSFSLDGFTAQFGVRFTFGK